MVLTKEQEQRINHKKKGGGNRKWQTVGIILF
jgi:hypothetical protein